MATDKDSIRVVENGVVRWKRPPGVQKRNAPSPKGRTLSDEQIDGTEEITEDELSRALGGMSVDNLMRNKSHSYKKRNGLGRPKSLDVMLRRAKALELRRAGFTWQEIANRKVLGYSSARAVQRDVARLLSQMIDVPAREVLGVELSRLDAITQALWSNVRSGDLASIDRVFTAMRHRAELLGLHHININHTVDVKTEMDKEIQRLTQELESLEKKDEGGTSISNKDELEIARQAAGLD